MLHSSSEDDLSSVARPAVGSPDGALVVLHGRGSDMHDALGLGSALDPRGRMLVVAPQAPLQLPPGGWHWYRLGGIPTPDTKTFTASIARLVRWIERLPEQTGVALDRTVVTGFSQGCVMTWALAAGPDSPSLAATIHIAGFLPQVEGYDLDLGRLANRPALVVHGVQDHVIDVAWGREAHTAAVAAGVHARWVETSAAHGVDREGAREMIAFIDDVVPVS